MYVFIDITVCSINSCCSDDGKLEMILKSGPMEVQMIRRREKFVFHVEEENDWLIKFTKITEQPIPRDHDYQDKAMAKPRAGYDNAELDVSETIQLAHTTSHAQTGEL